MKTTESRRIYMRRWRATERGRALTAKASREYRASGRASQLTRERRKSANRLALLLKDTRKKCRLRGIAFDLTLADLQGEACDCCGSAFDNVQRAASSTLDRLRPSAGYVRGNVFVLCFTCNRRKQDSSAADLEAIAAWIRSKGAP